MILMVMCSSLDGERKGDQVKIGGARSPLERILQSPQFSTATRINIAAEVTAYCTEACCNSGFVHVNGTPVFIDWSNHIAAEGNVRIDQLMGAGVDLVAVDTSVIPFGSLIRYDGKLYAALDRGSLIRGNCIDIAMRHHSEANLFGRRKNEVIEVFVPRNPQQALSAILGLAVKYASR
jgi:3D (Asp-Asp-Asp) domain-containing protein